MRTKRILILVKMVGDQGIFPVHAVYLEIESATNPIPCHVRQLVAKTLWTFYGRLLWNIYEGSTHRQSREMKEEREREREKNKDGEK